MFDLSALGASMLWVVRGVNASGAAAASLNVVHVNDPERASANGIHVAVTSARTGSNRQPSTDQIAGFRLFFFALTSSVHTCAAKLQACRP